MSEVSAHQRRERAVTALAGRQYGRVSTRQLRALSLTDDDIGYRVRTGHLTRVHRGVYAVGPRLPSAEARRMEAVLTVAGSCLVGRSAGAHVGLRPYGGVPEVAVRRGGGRTRPGIVVVLHPTYLAVEDVIVVDGIPTTTWAPTALDLATVLDGDGLTRVLTRAGQLDVFDLHALDAAMRRAPGHPGSTRLRWTLAAMHPDLALTDSDLEITMATLTDQHQLPRARFQVPLLGQRVDVFWPDARLVAQTDGFAFHRARAAFQADRTHDRALLLAGYRVLRFTWEDLTFRPGDVADDLRQALGDDV